MSKPTDDLKDKVEAINDSAEMFAEASIARLETKAEETSITPVAALIIDLATLGIGAGILHFGSGLPATVIGGIVAFVGIFGLVGKVLKRL